MFSSRQNSWSYISIALALSPTCCIHTLGVVSLCAACTSEASVLSVALQDFCSASRIPVFQDCISFLTRPRENKKAAYCLEGLFKSAGTDRKVHLLRQAFHLGRNPLRMLGLQDPYAVSCVPFGRSCSGLCYLALDRSY